MSYMDCPTPTSAASCSTTSIPSSARVTTAGSVTDPRTSSAREFQYAGSWPSGPCTWDSRLSRTRTRYPCPISASTRCDPTNPAPPVTNTCSATRLSSLRGADQRRRAILPRHGALQNLLVPGDNVLPLIRLPDTLARAFAQPPREVRLCQDAPHHRSEVVRVLPVQQRRIADDLGVEGHVEREHAVAVAQRLEQRGIRPADLVAVHVRQRAAVQLADVAGPVHRAQKHHPGI